MSALDVKNDEMELYRAMSKLAGNLFLQFNQQLIAGVQKLTEGIGPSNVAPAGNLGALANRSNLSDKELAVLTKYPQEEVYKAWKKHIDSIDYSICFRPRVDKPAESIDLLALPGEKITVSDAAADGSIGAQASWQIEIDLGIIRGKVSW